MRHLLHAVEVQNVELGFLEAGQPAGAAHRHRGPQKGHSWESGNCRASRWSSTVWWEELTLSPYTPASGHHHLGFFIRVIRKWNFCLSFIFHGFTPKLLEGLSLNWAQDVICGRHEKFTFVTSCGERVHVTAHLWEWPCLLSTLDRESEGLKFQHPKRSEGLKLHGCTFHMGNSTECVLEWATGQLSDFSWQAVGRPASR